MIAPSEGRDGMTNFCVGMSLMLIGTSLMMLFRKIPFIVLLCAIASLAGMSFMIYGVYLAKEPLYVSFMLSILAMYVNYGAREGSGKNS
jgi:hypothetical protein